MARTRIKICGVTQRDHAKLASDEGADAIGLNFWRDSPRYLSIRDAAAIAEVLPPFVAAIGVFVNAAERDIRAVLDAVDLDLLQFHGDETAEFCARFGKPYLRAVRMEAGVDLLEYSDRFSRAKALLLDAHVPGQPGGTGRTFDWSGIPRGLKLPVVLSGGLTPDNVGRAMRAVRPWAVDVSSGVESGRGVKDPRKIVAFIRSVQHEDAGAS